MNVLTDSNNKAYISVDNKPMYRFSEHFSVSEMFHTDQPEFKITNKYGLTFQNVRNLIRLTHVLEYVRHLLGDVPLRVNSAYRCPRLNDVVGGAKGSFHIYGCAADISVVPTAFFTERLLELKKLGILSEVIPHKTYYHIAIPNYEI